MDESIFEINSAILNQLLLTKKNDSHNCVKDLIDMQNDSDSFKNNYFLLFIILNFWTFHVNLRRLNRFRELIQSYHQISKLTNASKSDHIYYNNNNNTMIGNNFFAIMAAKPERSPSLAVHILLYSIYTHIYSHQHT